MVFLKLATLPLLSVNRPSSKTCNKILNTSGCAFSISSILQEVWGYTAERHVDTRVVDVHISRLRSKLEEDPSNPDLILTARGTGYMFQKITEKQKFEI